MVLRLERVCCKFMDDRSVLFYNCFVRFRKARQSDLISSSRHAPPDISPGNKAYQFLHSSYVRVAFVPLVLTSDDAYVRVFMLVLLLSIVVRSEVLVSCLAQ